jgi:hypothetical protein
MKVIQAVIHPLTERQKTKVATCYYLCRWWETKSLNCGPQVIYDYTEPRWNDI